MAWLVCHSVLLVLMYNEGAVNMYMYRGVEVGVAVGVTVVIRGSPPFRMDLSPCRVTMSSLEDFEMKLNQVSNTAYA